VISPRRAALAAAVAVALVASACTGKDAVDQSANGYSFPGGNKLGTTFDIGKRKLAGGFSAPLLDGGSVSLAQSAGKVVLINFWATWCGPCATETPQLDALYREMKAKNVAFIGIDTKDIRNKAESFVKNNDITFPIAFDEQGKTAVALGKIPDNSLPFTVLIDKQQRVAAVYLSRVTAKDLRPVLDKLLAES
jgi:peroxiredoxin